jgi:hypothetical protein
VWRTEGLVAETTKEPDAGIYGWRGFLRIPDLETSPAEKARIDRPGAGSEQRKSEAPGMCVPVTTTSCSPSDFC